MTLISGSDKIAMFGAQGMAGSAIFRALHQRGYRSLLRPSRNALDCLDRSAVEQWMQKF